MDEEAVVVAEVRREVEVATWDEGDSLLEEVDIVVDTEAIVGEDIPHTKRWSAKVSCSEKMESHKMLQYGIGKQ